MRARFVVAAVVGAALGLLAARPPAVVITNQIDVYAAAGAAPGAAPRLVTISRQAVRPRVSPELVATALGLDGNDRILALDRRPAGLADVARRWATSPVGASMRIDLERGGAAGEVIVLVEP